MPKVEILSKIENNLVRHFEKHKFGALFPWQTENLNEMKVVDKCMKNVFFISSIFP